MSSEFEDDIRVHSSESDEELRQLEYGTAGNPNGEHFIIKRFRFFAAIISKSSSKLW